MKPKRRRRPADDGPDVCARCGRRIERFCPDCTTNDFEPSKGEPRRPKLTVSDQRWNGRPF